MKTMCLIVFSSILVSNVGIASAQLGKGVASTTDERGKLSLTMSVVASNVAVEVVESEITLPEDFANGDFEATLSDDLSVSSTIVSGSVNYRVLPFLDLNARVGFVTTDTESGITISGTPTGTFSDFFSGPISLDREQTLEVDGYSLGLGANAFLPVAEVGKGTVAAYTGFQYIWNEFDEDVSSEGAKTSFGLVYPVNGRRNEIIYRVGGSYNWISRDIDRSLTLNGQPVRVQITQEFENPWAIEAGAAFPVRHNVLLSVGAWHQLSGETSALAAISYRFD